MTFTVMAPRLSERDEASGTEGGIDPLGLAAIADRLGTLLVPGVRERQLHPRFLTAIAVSLKVCEEFEDEIAVDGVSEPWQVFEWYLVEGIVRTSRVASEASADGGETNSEVIRDELPTTRGVPGSLKARKALDANATLSAKRYLRTPTVFGFHGVYRVLARTLGIEDGDSGRLGTAGSNLLRVWSEERGLAGFAGSTDGPGKTVLPDLRRAVADGLRAKATDRGNGWFGWQFFREHLDLYKSGKNEANCLQQLLLSDRGDANQYRREVLSFLKSSEGRRAFESGSERKFHAALRAHTDSAGLVELLDRIDRYEEFARLCQDAFDACLIEMTRANGKVTLGQLSEQPAVQRAADRVPGVFERLLTRLETTDAARMRESFATLATRCATAKEWVSLLLQHHCDTQQQKRPVCKQPWIVPMGEQWQIRSRYQSRYLPDGAMTDDDGNRYVHAYRTNSLWNFLRDLEAKP